MVLLWELPIEGDAVEEHVGEVLPIVGAENSSLVNLKLSSRPKGELARRCGGVRRHFCCRL